MREIKFRFWIKSKAEMLYSHPHPYPAVSSNGYVILCHKGGDIHFSSENYIPLQYTGLKDKNGKEIYEGDVVTANNGYFKDRIIFTDGCFRFFYDRYDYLWHFNEAVEVIGNIYENPELLKGG